MKRLPYSSLLFNLGIVALLSCLLPFSSFTLLAQESNKPTYTLHEVKAKETVYSLSKQFGVTENDIYLLNPGSESGIRIGQKLRIPLQKKNVTKQTPTTTPTSKSKTIHIVSAGETFYAIGRKYNISPALLRQYNPDITPSKLSPGMEIRIALADGTPLSKAQNNLFVASVEKETIKIAILLPLDLSSGKPQRYVRFYEGFLMGIQKAQKQGISIDLDLYCTPSKNSFEKVLHSGELVDCDIILGGKNNSEIATLANYTTERGIIYVSPFIASEIPLRKNSSNVFKLNVVQKYFFPFITNSFYDRYKHHHILFVSTQRKNHLSLVQSLKANLIKKKVSFQEISLNSLSPSTIKAKNSVIVLDDSSKESLQNLLDKVKNSNNSLTLFGYPEWQSYGKNIREKLADYESTIYSSFYSSPVQTNIQNFSKKYQDWFSKPIDQTYPKFSILGYDIANFFITAFANYGNTFLNNSSQAPQDGLQTDFIFCKGKGDESYSNMNLFFISFKKNGEIIKTRIVY